MKLQLKTSLQPLLLVLLMVLLIGSSCSRYTVYSVRTRPARTLPGGLIYALPHTQLRVAVALEKADYSNAPYAPYAHDYLGLPAHSGDSVYRINSVSITAVNEADPQRYYFVVPRRTAIGIDSRGLLQSVGLNYDQLSAPQLSAAPSAPTRTADNLLLSQAQYNLYDRADTFYTRYDKPGRPSLVTNKQDVRNTRQRAMAAAQQIENIREKRIQLVFGEYEGNYNSDAIQYINHQLEEQERLLLSQFVGSAVADTLVFWVDPKDEKTLIDSQTVELFRFSPVWGIVDSTMAEALVVRCNIRCENKLRSASRFIRYRTRVVGESNWKDRHTFKYRIPETAVVTIWAESADDSLQSATPVWSYQKVVKIAQFGTLANLPAGPVKAKFDPTTGDPVRQGSGLLVDSVKIAVRCYDKPSLTRVDNTDLTLLPANQHHCIS